MEQWKDLLAFNRTERRGIWLLLVLIAIAMVSGRLISGKRSKPDHELLHVMLIEGEEQRFKEKGELRKQYPRKKMVKNKKDSLFIFDPNKLGAREWQLLGLSEKQANSLVNYVSKGGQFRTGQDLKRSFVISEEFFKKVEPYITIRPSEDAKNKPLKVRELPATTDINLADTLQWRMLPGIGTVLAARIVKYRESLGGFHSIEQLLEVYGVKEEVIEKNRSRLSTGAWVVKKIPINTAGPHILSSHPYIDRKLAYMLTELRKEAPFSSEDDLKHRLPEGLSIHPHLWPYIGY